MSGLRCELLIDRIRRASKNTNYGTNSGISQRLAQDFVNDALKEIWRAVVLAKTSSFIKSYTTDIVANQDLYDLPPRIFLGKEVCEVHFSQDGNDDNYYVLNPLQIERREQFLGTPDGWFLLDGQLALNPTPNQNITNGLRIYYREQMPYLSVRYGDVDDTTTIFNTTSKVFTTGPTLDPSGDFFNPTGADDLDYLCIVDRDGAFKVRDIRIDSIDATTGAVTVASGWLGGSSDVTPATGDFFVSGKNATTHTPLDGEFDEFITKKAAAFMAMEDKDLELAGALNDEADKTKANLVKIYAPSHYKGRRPIKGFNDMGDPYRWW